MNQKGATGCFFCRYVRDSADLIADESGAALSSSSDTSGSIDPTLAKTLAGDFHNKECTACGRWQGLLPIGTRFIKPRTCAAAETAAPGTGACLDTDAAGGRLLPPFPVDRYDTLDVWIFTVLEWGLEQSVPWVGDLQAILAVIAGSICGEVPADEVDMPDFWQFISDLMVNMVEDEVFQSVSAAKTWLHGFAVALLTETQGESAFPAVLERLKPD